MVSLFIRLAVIATLVQASLISMPLAQRAPDFWPPAPAQSTEEIETLKGQVASLYEAGQYAEAIPLLRQLLTIQEKILGREHPDVAFSLYVLANLYDRQGRFDEAEPLYKRALAIREKALGDVAMAMGQA
jgi:tetratricopeptide (TPR) repeat protein